MSGQLLTEDYYVVNKFVKGYLGTANIDTNSRLCMSSAVAAHKRSFGEDLVPASYKDFEHTDMVVLVGSNTAWCHPVLYQRIMQAKTERDLTVVVIDPRFTATCEQADLHLPILPGQDVTLFNGLLQYLYQQGYTDHSFVTAYTENLDSALLASDAEADIKVVSEKTGIALEKLQQFRVAICSVTSSHVVTLRKSPRPIIGCNSLVSSPSVSARRLPLIHKRPKLEGCS